MADTRLTVEVNGDEIAADLLVAGAVIDVEEALDEADAASITIALEPEDSGEWTSLVDDLTFPDSTLRVSLESGDTSYAFAGLVAGATWNLDTEGASQLVVRAVGQTAEMDRVERVVAWPGAADSAIASTIFNSYGFGANVEPTPHGPDPDRFTPVQRGTDLSFLRSLAARWGYVAYLEVEGDKVVGHFQPIDPIASPSAELLLCFGGDAYSATVDVELDGGGTVRASRVPVLSDAVLTAESDGRDQLQGPEAIATARTQLLGPGDVDGEIDLPAAARGRVRDGAFGIRLTVTTDPIRRGPMLRARRTVDVKGLGSRLSGLYLVERVRHQLSSDHHQQQVTLIRNALGAASLLPRGLR